MKKKDGKMNLKKGRKKVLNTAINKTKITNVIFCIQTYQELLISIYMYMFNYLYLQKAETIK